MIDEDSWQAPQDLVDAQRQRRQLVAAVDEIKAQLSNRKIARQTGEDTSDPNVYLQWRGRTLWALTNRLQELRLLNAWIRENHGQARN